MSFLEELEALTEKLVKTVTVSGYEKKSAAAVLEICKEYAKDCFDEGYVTKSKSVVLVKKSKGQTKYSLAFDAHLDTVGFAVSEICEGGYLKTVPMGGIDVNILPSSEVLICGKKEIRAVFSSVPPHLSTSDKLPEIGQLLVDTGFETKQETEKYVEIGTPVVMYPHFTKLLNNRVSATGLDDKICITAVLYALKLLKDICLENTDIYCYFSSGEERGGNGSYHMYNEICPDAAVVLDVNFAKEKGSKDGEYGILGKGAMTSVSSVTNKALTKAVIDCARKNDIPLQTVLEMTSTGTNADVAPRTGSGFASAVLSVPLKYMHSSVECASLDDVVSAARILKELSLEYDKTPVSIPVYYKGGADGEL